MKTATLIKPVSPGKKLYRLSEPLRDGEGNPHTYVVVSAADVMLTGPETYIFPANENGEITDFGDLPGSYRGDFDHVRALSGAGYRILEGDA